METMVEQTVTKSHFDAVIKKLEEEIRTLQARIAKLEAYNRAR